LAKSHVRIHKGNLINHGILPLVFANRDDYDRCEMKDHLAIDSLAARLDPGNVAVRLEDKHIAVVIRGEVAEYGKQFLKAGGAMNCLRNRRKPRAVDRGSRGSRL
jgi:aconitate hydratase